MKFDGISAPFVRRPVATSLLAAAIVLGGAAAFGLLPVAPLPRVDFPTINVSASLPGASPETMASAVATPLERRFGRIAGITEITSASSLGSTGITLQFDMDRDVDSAARDVQAAINAAGAELPSNLPLKPNYRKSNPADSPIMILSLTSDTVPLAQIFDAANTVLAQKISQVNGVGQVFVGGGQQPAVRVQTDPRALAGANLTLEELRTSIANATSNQPKGAVSGGQQAQAIQANDQLHNADEWKNLIVGYSQGGAVRLQDVAVVKDDVENNRAAAWTNGVRSVIVVIRRQPGANIIEVIERVKALLPSLSASISPAIKTEVAVDRSQTIRASVVDVEQSLLISVGLVILVVFVFLRSVKATAIPSVAVPLALLGTFGAMYLLDYSLDILSLMALTISTGFVVDDAIVVTENIARYVEEGMSPLEAALKGAKQIGFTVVSITVSLLAVFVPLLFMQGLVGRLFREFAVTLAAAIAISALVSLTVTPMMCARLLGHSKEKEPNRFAKAMERAFDKVHDAYANALTGVLEHRGLTLLLTAATAALSVILYIKTPTGLFPQQDTGQIGGASQAPQDISFTAMKERQKAALDVVQSDPDVDHAVGFIGGGPGGGTTNTGSVFISLKPRPQRKASADEIIARLRPKLAKVEGISLILQASQDVRVGGRGSRSQYQYTVQGADLKELQTYTPKLTAALQKLPGLKDVTSDQQTAGLQLELKIDRDTAARLGITPMQIDDTLYDAYGQRQVATTYSERNEYRVVMETMPKLQADASGLESIYLRSAQGGLVPLDTLVHQVPGSLPLAINHQGQFPSGTVSFNLAPGIALSDAVEGVKHAQSQLGIPDSLRADFAGTARAYADQQGGLLWLILTALLAVYVVLGMLYESYVHPITILSTLPSAGVGALLALNLWHMELNIIALVGLILLVGIVKKNAIMLIDFALEAERNQGLSPRDAIYQACLLRFRPILMTTLAALLGGLPLALGNGTGSELRAPLGIAIVGGLFLSQLLTMFTTPVVYLAMDRFTRPAHRRAAARQAAAATT
ncbi:MAG: multidrug efflux RND transporter permease subunit [Myxococcaceae bacterium]